MTDPNNGRRATDSLEDLGTQVDDPGCSSIVSPFHGALCNCCDSLPWSRVCLIAASPLRENALSELERPSGVSRQGLGSVATVGRLARDLDGRQSSQILPELEGASTDHSNPINHDSLQIKTAKEAYMGKKLITYRDLLRRSRGTAISLADPKKNIDSHSRIEQNDIRDSTDRQESKLERELDRERASKTLDPREKNPCRELGLAERECKPERRDTVQLEPITGLDSPARADDPRPGEIPKVTEFAEQGNLFGDPEIVLTSAQKKAVSKTVVKIPDEEVKCIAARVYLIWIGATGKNVNRTKLTPKRIKLIGARLRQGYSERDIMQAIRGFAASPWHQGDNPQGIEYNTLQWICETGDKIERGIGYYDRLIAKPKARREEKNKREAQEAKRLLDLTRIRKEQEARRAAEIEQSGVCRELDFDELDDLDFDDPEDR